MKTEYLILQLKFEYDLPFSHEIPKIGLRLECLEGLGR